VPEKHCRAIPGFQGYLRGVLDVREAVGAKAVSETVVDRLNTGGANCRIHCAGKRGCVREVLGDTISCGFVKVFSSLVFMLMPFTIGILIASLALAGWEIREQNNIWQFTPAWAVQNQTHQKNKYGEV